MTRLRRDSGFSLVEFSLALALTALIGTFVIGWMNSITSSRLVGGDAAQTQTDVVAAKERLVKELRFADSVSSDQSKTTSHKVTVWIDRVGVGTERAFDPGVGEEVTWEIHSDGRLTRVTDEAGTSPVVIVSSLVYDGAASPGSTRFSYPTPEVVQIDLVGQVGGSESKADPFEITTRVQLRNS